MGPVRRSEILVNSHITCQILNVDYVAVNHVLFVAGEPQKNDTSPFVPEIKYVKGVSCGEQLSSVFRLYLRNHKV